MSSIFDQIILKDMELLFNIQKTCNKFEWLNNFLRSIISKNPLQDIVFILFPFFLIGIFINNKIIGLEHFWVVSTNLLASFGKSENNL